MTLLETRHVKAALSAMAVKTDRNDARGIAQLLRLGWFKPVHAKALLAQEGRALLTARKLLVAGSRHDPGCATWRAASAACCGISA